MSSRGHPPSSGTMSHRLPPGSASTIQLSRDHQLPPELLEKKLVEEIRRLAGENHRLAEAQVILRRELISAQEEVQKVKAHVRSIQTESNIQIRVSLEKAAKMELECKEAARVKLELESSHKEEQELMDVMQDLMTHVERANKEHEIACADIKKLPAMISELEDMREEHHRLCTTFEREKQMNIEKVEHLRARERDLINMARHVGKLRADVLSAENALQTPAPVPASYGGLYPNPDPYQPPPSIGNGPSYIASSGAQGHTGSVQMNGMVVHPYDSSVAPPPPPPLPPPPPPPPPPPFDPPVSGEGSGGDENTLVKGENASADWRGGGGGYESSESRVNAA